MEELIANIFVPVLLLLSNYFFHSWAVIITVFLVSFLLNKTIRPYLADEWGGVGFLEDFKEKPGFRFLIRTFFFSIIVCYVSVSFIVFFNLKSNEYLKDNNIHGIFINREIFIFLGSFTPLYGVYSLYLLISNKISSPWLNFKNFISDKYLTANSFNAFTCGIFISSILCLIMYFAFKIKPDLMTMGWSWVRNYL